MLTGILSLVDEYFPFFLFLYLARYVKGIKDLSWVGARKCGAFLARIDRDPHPLVLGVG